MDNVAPHGCHSCKALAASAFAGAEDRRMLLGHLMALPWKSIEKMWPKMSGDLPDDKTQDRISGVVCFSTLNMLEACGSCPLNLSLKETTLARCVLAMLTHHPTGEEAKISQGQLLKLNKNVKVFWGQAR